MKNQIPKSLSMLMNQTNELQNIVQKAVSLVELNHEVKQLLPQNIQSYCRVANYRQHHLILEVANANWLMLLRYKQEDLLNKLRSRILPSLQKISMYINPHMLSDTSIIKVNGQNKSTIISREFSVNTRNQFTWLAKQSSGTLRKKFEKLANLK